MAITPVAFRVETAADLEAAFDAALAPLLAARISGIEIDQVKPGPFAGRNLYGVFNHDSAGAAVLLNPFRLRVFSHSDEAQVIQLINQFVAANPGYFFSDSYFTYRTQTPNPDDAVLGCIFYNVDGAAAALNWVGGGGAVVGVAGGDLSGFYPNPTVVGIQRTPVSAVAPTSGASFVFNSVTGDWEPVDPIRYFANGLAAMAAAPLIDGTTVVIYPGLIPAEAGTYQVTSNQGAAFPADYTKVSDLTDTAAEVSIVDVGNYFASTNVEGALQELGPLVPQAAQLSGALLVATNVMDLLPVASYTGVDWSIEVFNGASRYKSTIHATTSGAAATGVEDGIVLGPGVTSIPITFDVDVSGGNLRLLATATILGWQFRVRRLLLTV